jgi:hypothetical protein
VKSGEPEITTERIPRTDLPVPPAPRKADDPILVGNEFIFGTEIGGWRHDGRYDGHPVLVNEACQDLSRAANISVYRWLPWDRFTDQGGDMPREQFDNVIDGIMNLDAEPFIKLPPGAPRHFIREPAVDPAWLKEIVSQAGSRVNLYEFTNESNYYGRWSAQRYTEEWINVVPELRRHARSLGFEIQIGGPAFSGAELSYITVFLRGVKAEYERTGDADLLPAFISWHHYMTWNPKTSNREILEGVSDVGWFTKRVRAESIHIFGFELPTAITEWNYISEYDPRHETDPDFIHAYTTGMLEQFLEVGCGWRTSSRLPAVQAMGRWTWSPWTASQRQCTRPSRSSLRPPPLAPESSTRRRTRTYRRG